MTITSISESIQKNYSPTASCKRVQIVMDRFGDTRHEFDAADPHAVAMAEKRFQELTRNGFRAAALTQDGSPGRLIRSFDPEIERTLFVPQLNGG